MINIPGKVLIFAAHHDDETISCAGTIRKLSDLGAKITVVFATDGATGVDHTKKYENKIISTRVDEAKKVAKILGIDKIINWGYPCQNLKNSAENMRLAVKVIRSEKPDLIITHSLEEKHSDHKNLCLLVKQAAWKASEDIMPKLGYPFRVKDLWSFEVVDPMSTVDYCVDITNYMDDKITAMKVYESQEKVVSGIIDYIEGIAKIRGYSIGTKFAEGFKKNSMQPTEVFKLK